MEKWFFEKHCKTQYKITKIKVPKDQKTMKNRSKMGWKIDTNLNIPWKCFKMPQKSNFEGQVGLSWPNLAPTWANLAPTWRILAPTWPNLPPTWANLGAYLGSSWPILAHLGPMLASRSPKMASRCAKLPQVGLKLAQVRLNLGQLRPTWPSNPRFFIDFEGHVGFKNRQKINIYKKSEKCENLLLA